MTSRRAERLDAAQTGAARIRVRIAAARVARQRGRATLPHRIAGRLVGGLTPLDPTLDYAAPALRMAADPALALLVLQSAAAALVADQLALAITPRDISAQNEAGNIPDAARAFALSHRHLAIPGGDHALRLREVRACWAASLPEPLAGEYALPDGVVPSPAPAPAAPIAIPDMPARPQRNRLSCLQDLWRPAPIILPLAPPPPADPPAAALTAALRVFLHDQGAAS